MNDTEKLKQIIMDNAKYICSLVDNPMWEDIGVTEGMDGITIYAKVKKGIRVRIRSNVYGTLLGASMWKGRMTYTILEDGAYDCCIMYPEEFMVLESEVK